MFAVRFEGESGRKWSQRLKARSALKSQAAALSFRSKNDKLPFSSDKTFYNSIHDITQLNAFSVLLLNLFHKDSAFDI